MGLFYWAHKWFCENVRWIQRIRKLKVIVICLLLASKSPLGSQVLIEMGEFWGVKQNLCNPHIDCLFHTWEWLLHEGKTNVPLEDWGQLFRYQKWKHCVIVDWGTFGIGDIYAKMLLQRCYFSVGEPVSSLRIIWLSEILIIYPGNIVINKRIGLNTINVIQKILIQVILKEKLFDLGIGN